MPKPQPEPELEPEPEALAESELWRSTTAASKEQRRSSPVLKQKRKERRIRKRKELAKRQHPKAEQIALILEYIDWRVLGSPLELLQVTALACTRLCSATPSASHLLLLLHMTCGRMTLPGSWTCGGPR